MTFLLLILGFNLKLGIDSEMVSDPGLFEAESHNLVPLFGLLRVITRPFWK